MLSADSALCVCICVYKGGAESYEKYVQNVKN